MEKSEALYRSRGELRTSKIRSDIVTGALAEFAVFKYLTDKGQPCSPPDLSILEVRNKSFAADLMSGDVHVHVKSQTIESANKHGTSFLFQKTDKILSTPSETALMAFCIVHPENVEIKAIVKVLDIVEANLLDKPKVFIYQQSKNAIYLDAVLSSKINLWSI